MNIWNNLKCFKRKFKKIFKKNYKMTVNIKYSNINNKKKLLNLFIYFIIFKWIKTTS